MALFPASGGIKIKSVDATVNLTANSAAAPFTNWGTVSYSTLGVSKDKIISVVMGLVGAYALVSSNIGVASNSSGNQTVTVVYYE